MRLKIHRLLCICQVNNSFNLKIRRLLLICKFNSRFSLVIPTTHMEPTSSKICIRNLITMVVITTGECSSRTGTIIHI
ncbi:uncharacterized protein LOC123469991 isoform X2 [Daphnia magna]|uniref:uncharacterized protein LOC123469991 isoform X2 n=1 Tax=Daphnia magna TaxID=35525 RepID=UPI001E1BAB62|nr:uncharacterized protein LOC123469991 isoform X2 [Daphnia magna]